MKKTIRVILVVVLAIALLLGAGFVYLYFNGMSGIANTSEATLGQTKIACVGDSITYGHGTSSWPQNSYPAKLQELLGDGFHVNNYGVSGHAVQNDSDRPYRTVAAYQESVDYNADIVVLMMGSNDSKPENWKGAEAYRTDLISLLESYGDAEIILCTPATAFFTDGKTSGVTSHDIQPLIVEEIAQITKDVAAEMGYTLVDIHALTAQYPEWFSADGVHPSNEGAAAIAAEIFDAVRK